VTIIWGWEEVPLKWMSQAGVSRLRGSEHEEQGLVTRTKVNAWNLTYFYHTGLERKWLVDNQSNYI